MIGKERAGLACALVAGAVLVSGCRAQDPAPAPPPEARPEPDGAGASAAPVSSETVTGDVLPAEAFTAYDAARAAVRARNYDEAKRQFLIAVQVEPDFTEAWYNLGATNGVLSLAEAGAGGDAEAVALFREGVEAKKRARDLIDQGKWFVYKTEAEQSQVKDDLRHALEDADDVLADEPSLLVALRLQAQGRR